MADPSLNTNISTFTSDSLKDEDGEKKLVEEPTLRPRLRFNHFPKLEEVDDKYRDKIFTLPKEEGWASKLRQYKGSWILEEIIPGVLSMEEAFKPRPNDIIVASSMKSGTTWLKALTFTIVHRNKYAFSSHPFLQLNPHDCVPMIEFNYSVKGEAQYLETLPSPRVLGTHLNYSILPESIKTSECPIVYICREPKDVLVSLWHMVKRSNWSAKSITLTQIFELFCQGRVPFGPVWDHVLEYYRVSLHKNDKILFLKYEEMMKDPIDGVMRIANFVGCPFTEEEVQNGVVKKIVEFCSINELKGLDVNKIEIDPSNGYYFRKAVVGDWENYMTTEMATKLDSITEEKFHHSGFTLWSNKH